ncbi:MAG TPA: caspase family protein [Terriglobia bacterium]|nr:caspase family protein [Terriglobia bacterium]
MEAVASQATTGPAQYGPYYALVIGNDSYRYLPQLKTAVNDADAVAALLHRRYGFEIQVLKNATREQILGALNEYRRTLPDQANLLIYYAGHGNYDKETDKAYWLPVEAKADNNTDWIIADDITSDARAIPARHVLVISDSCYSGGLNRDVNTDITPRERGRYLQRMLQARSRNLMSSGGNEPVADGGAPGHSVFASALLLGLAQMDEDAFTATDLFNRFVQPRVAGRSEQVPQYSMIRNSGHEDGDFVFSAHPHPGGRSFDIANAAAQQVTYPAAAAQQVSKPAAAPRQEAQQSEVDQSYNLTKQAFDQAVALENQKKYAEAAALFQTAEHSATGHNLTVVLTHEAYCYLLAKNNDQAASSYQRLLALNPDNADAHNGLAFAFAGAGKFPEALAECEKSVHIESAGRSPCYYNIGATASNQGLMDEAAAAFKKATELDPNNANAFFLEGQSLMAKATMGPPPDNKIIPVPGTVEALETYLQLDPRGQYAEGARAMLQILQSGVQTGFRAPKKKK